MPLVSVIVPVYNVKKYLRNCIDSIAKQTLTDIEIICVDDGSTDGSADILDEYAKIDARIKVVHQKNQGQGIARNNALDVAQGEYVAFVDSDDFIHNQMLEILVSVAKKTGQDVVALDSFNKLSKNEEFSQHIDVNNLKYAVHTHPLKHLLSNTWTSSIIWNKLYKRTIIGDKRFIEGIYFEDWPFVTCLFADLKKYVTVPYPLYNYNDLSVSTVRSTFTVKKIDDYVRGIEYTYNFFNQQKYQKMKRSVQAKRIVPSISMMINKTNREKKNRAELIAHLVGVLRDLRRRKIFYFKDLHMKTDIRLFKLWLTNMVHVKKNNKLKDFKNKIDLVYLWCDGNDENFIKERNYWAQKEDNISLQATNPCRFIDNNELKYSLRSAEMFAPWINKIYIVTNGQVPEWLDLNHPKIKLVKHSEFMPEECLPTFNSCAIEAYLPYIPGLSEYFLYANDDMFFAAPVKPEDFFDKKGYPIVRLSKCAWTEEMIKNEMYQNTVVYSQNLCGDKYGKYYRYQPCHNIDAYRKSYCIECIDSFKKEFELVGRKRFREKNTVQRVIYSYYMLANNEGVLSVGNTRTTEGEYIACNITNLSSIVLPKELKLICFNDTETANDNDRRDAKKFMMSLFNIPQSWEKSVEYQILPLSDSKEAIVFACDSRFCKYFSVTLQSLIDNSSPNKNYDLILFEEDLSDNQKYKINNMLPKNFTLRFFDVSEIINDKFAQLHFKTTSRWSIAMFYRIFIPLIMQHYKCVLYLDSDICINASIDDIFGINDDQKGILAIKDAWGLREHGNNYIANNITWHMQNELKIEELQNYFNSGVIRFNISNINLDAYIDKFKSAMLIENLLFPDQDILNVIFKDDVKYLSWKWNFQYRELEFNKHFKEDILPEFREDILDALACPCVIHYTGSKKPWDAPDAWFSEVFWKYARKTPFYEEIIYSSCKLLNDNLNQSDANKIADKERRGNRYSFVEHFVSKKTKTKNNGNVVTHYRFLGVSLFKKVKEPRNEEKSYLLGVRVA